MPKSITSTYIFTKKERNSLKKNTPSTETLIEVTSMLQKGLFFKYSAKN